jgi:predicted oxidoreductase
MQTYRLMQTDLDVSRLALGTWNLGGEWDDSPLTSELVERAQSLLRTAVDHGVNFIDLADIYVRGKSDEVVGRALAADRSLRDALILQAKCGIVLGGQGHPNDPAHYNFETNHIVAAVEGTLTRLGTDRVELLLLHRPDPLVEPEEVASAWDQLHSAGKVRYFGVSNHTAQQIELLKRNVRQPLVVNQLELNLLHHHLITDGMMANTQDADRFGCTGTLDYCRLHDISIQAWSPLARGQMFQPGSDASAEVQATARTLGAIAEAHGTAPECVALAWLLRHPARIQPIIGTMNPTRLATACAADAVNLTRLEWFRLLEAARGRQVP